MWTSIRKDLICHNSFMAIRAQASWMIRNVLAIGKVWLALGDMSKLVHDNLSIPALVRGKLPDVDR